MPQDDQSKVIRDETRLDTKGSNVIKKAGINCQTPPVKRDLVYTGSPSATTFKNQETIVCLGSDMPTHVGSGFGGAASDYAPAINLECLPRLVSNTAAHGHSTPGKYVSSSWKHPARLYISGRTSCDEDLGLVKGTIGNDSKGKSAIMGVADVIGFKARDYIKISTCSPGDEKNTLGGRKKMIHGIDFNVGNRDGKDKNGNNFLQATVKGENLVDLLKLLIKGNIALSKRVQKLAKLQRQMSSKNSKHTHVVGTPGTPCATSIEEQCTHFALSPKMFGECEAPAGKNIVDWYEAIEKNFLKNKNAPDWILSHVRVS